MRYWLMKTEPKSYSIDDLKKDRITPWDGVRNYQARNMMRDEMQVGDLVLFYHSNATPPGIVGTAQVSRKAYPDPTAFDPEDHHFDPKSDPAHPRWVMVDIQFIKKFNRVISLSELREHPELIEMIILRKGNRLSITPITPKEWQIIQSLAA